MCVCLCVCIAIFLAKSIKTNDQKAKTSSTSGFMHACCHKAIRFVSGWANMSNWTQSTHTTWDIIIKCMLMQCSELTP